MKNVTINGITITVGKAYNGTYGMMIDKPHVEGYHSLTKKQALKFYNNYIHLIKTKQITL